MTSLKNISSKADITQGLKESFDQVHSSFGPVNQELFFQKYNDKWSAGENLDHLIRSTKGISSALKMKKMILGMTFGKAKKPSRTLKEIFNTYKAALADGTAVASGEYLPKDDKRMDRETSLNNWKMIGEKFEARLANWSESDLDTYRLPHPVLGKMTMREMMFFTIIHNRHHLKAIEVVKEGLSVV